MTEKIKHQKDYIESRKHRAFRRDLTEEELKEILPQIRDRKKSYMQRATTRLVLFLRCEKPVVLDDTEIPILRTIRDFPDIYNEGETDEIKQTHYIHEKGKVTNLSWDVLNVLREGLEGRRTHLLNGEKRDAEFVKCAGETIDAVIEFADKYASALRSAGRAAEGERISRTARYGAKTMLEAFTLFRLIHFSLWASGCYHNTVGRFDQWLLPFYEHDKSEGMSDERVLELTEDFFLSFNRDSDLYYSLAWGDNGQSLVIGGMLPDGSDGTNTLTLLTLTAARELRQIDPKINLRVNRDTPIELFEEGTKLTKIGLGFPQYSNDDVVIPCLEHWGYDREDARNYAIAACWEFIIPNKAMDIPNIAGMPLAEIVHDTVEEHLKECADTEELMKFIKAAMDRKAAEMTAAVKDLFLEPSPMMSLLMGDCADRGEDVSQGLKYNNYGFHGTGLSCAADQVAAIDSLMFGKKKFTADRLLRGLETNFRADRELRYMLRNDADKMGRDENANNIGDRLLAMFADSLDGIRNERGGIFRAGTGTAMYYVWHSEHLGATADGRDAYAYIPANFSPSLFLTDAGPLSVLLAFAPKSLLRTSNGGPMTFELHDTVFKSADSIHKVAELVRAYIKAGGHQLQINSVNNDKMRKAQKHPEEYKDLIVRVWGWSGHFVELDKCYQDQVIERVEYGAE